MHKLKLEELKVDSFATQADGTETERGTVRAHASGAGVTCQLTCGVSCVIAETCQASCRGTCYFSCLHNTCDFSCVDVNTCHC